jgi:putative CocE/NonD family hydrolase
MQNSRALLISTFALLSAITPLSFVEAQSTAAEMLAERNAEHIRSSYTKFEHRIPMRDGAKLHTAIYVPNDRGKEYPFLLFRTPYSCRPYGADAYRTTLGPDMSFVREGYIFVYQDVRGRLMSEGDFVNMTPHVPKKTGPKDIDESTDTFDTIEWLLANVDRHNGRVGQWGISYPGFYTIAGAIDSHPALKAVSPQAPIADWFWDDFHHHGAFFLPHGFNFISRFGKPRPELTTEPTPSFDHGTPDGYKFFLEMGPVSNANEKYLEGKIPVWNEIVKHPNYDEFWQSRNILPHLENVRCAVMTVGGWFDAEDLYGPLKIYREVEKNNPGTFNVLVMGPWDHGGWGRRDGDALGNARFGFKTSEFYREKILSPFFRERLKGVGKANLPEAYVFETGANRWRTFDAWPPKSLIEQSLYVLADGGLSFYAPEDADPAFDEYVSDPAKPVPFTEATAIGMTREYMTDDQRFAARRPDVLAYQTPALGGDITLAGPLQAELWVSTSGTASDWVVKLIDVLPDSAEDPDPNPRGVRMGGYQMMVRSEVIRGRFRNSYEHPEPFVSNEPTKVSFELQDVLHTFKKGHRIMIQIQSTWFPLVDRNPQKYVPNIFEAREEDFIKATQRVYRSKSRASRVRIGILRATY